MEDIGIKILLNFVVAALSQPQDCRLLENAERVYNLLDPLNESNTSVCVKGAWAIVQQTQ